MLWIKINQGKCSVGARVRAMGNLKKIGQETVQQEVVFGSVFKGGEGKSPKYIWGKDIPRRRNSKCKTPKVEVFLTDLKHQQGIQWRDKERSRRILEMSQGKKQGVK